MFYNFHSCILIKYVTNIANVDRLSGSTQHKRWKTVTGLPLFSWAVLAEDIQKHHEEQIYGGETVEKEQFYSFQLLP